MAATTGKQTDDVIASFNQSHSLIDLLTAAGYPLGWQRGNVARLSRPGKPKNETSVIVFTDINRSYHHSGNDALYTTGHTRDAFDVWTHITHNGDTKAAWAAAKQEQGKWEAAPVLVFDHKPQSIGSTIRRIVVNKRQDRDILDDTIEAIRTVNAAQNSNPILYARAGILSQVATDENGNHFIRNAEGAVLSSILVHAVDWVKQYRDKTGEIYLDDTSIPERIVKMLEVPTGWAHVPPCLLYTSPSPRD